jgi:hypothetical protein
MVRGDLTLGVAVLSPISEGSAQSMIRHEVIVRVQSEISTEIVERTALDAARLLGEIPGVERVRFGFSASPTNRHMMFALDLTDELALHRMGRHSSHARAVRIIGRLADLTAVGSYLVGSERGQS